MRIFRTVLIIPAVLVMAGVATIYVSNLLLLQRTYAVEPVRIAADSAPDAAARGKRIADITGCTDCHGADLRGKVFIDEGWWHGRYYASNLTLLAQKYSDADFARIVRTGVRPDGHGVVAMPAFGFCRLTDAEMAAVIAFIRSLPPGGKIQPVHHIGPLDQWDLWTGKVKPAVGYVESETKMSPVDLGPSHATGQHLAAIACTECHRGDLTGDGWNTGAPDLVVAAAYTREAFSGLLRTGVGADGKEHGLMSIVAKDRLHHLSDDDIGALHAYLLERARRPR